MILDASGGRSLTHEPLNSQSCINGLSVPSAMLWCSRRSIRRLSDRDLTRERIFYSANFALRVLAKNRIRFHSEWNRESFKMNVQRIQLNLSPTFSGLSDRDLTRERIFWSANLALRVRAKNRIRFHTEWNRKSFKMNAQRIELNLSPIFSESRRDNVKQEMSFSTEKNRKISFMQNEKLFLYDYSSKIPLLRVFLPRH